MRLKIGKYRIAIHIYKKDTKIRGSKWLEKVPMNTFNSKGNIYSSLFFHIFVDKTLFELPDDFSMNDFCEYRRDKDDDLETVKKRFMKEKYNMDI